jgi:hypothetical protein
MTLAMSAPFSRPRWSAAALTWCLSAFLLLGSAPPASLAANDGGSAGSDNNDEDDDPCLLYLAQSTIPNGTASIIHHVIFLRNVHLLLILYDIFSFNL